MEQMNENWVSDENCRGSKISDGDVEQNNKSWLQVDAVPNPFADHEAVKAFLTLYTGKQRRDPKCWLDYFTSDAFLEAAWEWGFAEMLMEHTARLEKEWPVNREFLNWLCVAYQFMVDRQVYREKDGSERVEFSFRIFTGAQFDGQDAIFEIATRGPAPKQFKGNELAMVYSFQEYRRLVLLAKSALWDETAVGEASEIIGHYAACYITDKCRHQGTWTTSATPLA